MKIAVIGSISKDIIIPNKGVPCKSFGGTFYQITTLQNFLGENDVVCPVSYYSEDISYIISGLAEKWGNIDISGLIPIKKRNYQQIFEYSSESKKAQKSFFHFPTLQFNQIEKFIDADMLLLNLTSYEDLSLEEFKLLTKSSYDKLYLNVRSILSKTDGLGNKIPHRSEEIYDWLNYAKYIQLNETEYNILNQENIDFRRFWEGLLRPSQNVFYTLGNKGVWWISNKKGLKIKKFPAYSVNEVKETTGCGEVFSAAFCYGYIKTQKIAPAIELGILAASSSCSIIGTENMHALKNIMGKLDRKIVEAVV